MALPSNVILNIPIVASVVAEAPLTTENNQFNIGISCLTFARLLAHEFALCSALLPGDKSQELMRILCLLLVIPVKFCKPLAKIVHKNTFSMNLLSCKLCCEV